MDISSNFNTNTVNIIDSSNYNPKFVVYNNGVSLNNSYLSTMISDNPNINHYLFGTQYINNNTNLKCTGHTGTYFNSANLGNTQNYIGPSGSNFVPISYTGGSGTNELKISNYFNKKNKIQISYEIANYFELNDTNCYIDDIKNAIEKKSEENKKNGNSIKSVNFAKKSTIFLDSKGKQLFKLKVNYIDINCLIDLIHFSNKRPEYDFFEYTQTPINIDKL